MAKLFLIITAVVYITAGLTGYSMENQSVTTGSLPNGLRYVIDSNHDSDVVTVVAVIKAGSIYEKETYGCGLSHFLEHLVHSGTTSVRTEDDYRLLLESIGNNSNAYTTRDHTLYYITTTRQHWGKALKAISEWIFDCQLKEEEYAREKGVVTREIEKGMNEPNRVISKRHAEQMFTLHPVRYPVIGYKHLFTEVTYKQVQAYYKRMYIPQNVIMSISGAVDAEEARSQLAALCGRYPAGIGIEFAETIEPRQMGKREHTEIMDVKAGYVYMGFRTITLDHPDLFALDVLADILTGGTTSRLTHTIKEEKGLAFSVGAWSRTPVYDAGEFGIWMVADPANVYKLDTEVRTILDSITADGVSDEELQKVITLMEMDHIRSQRTAESRARSFAINMLAAGNPLFDAYYIDGIRKVTSAQVQEVCKRYLREDNLTITRLMPAAAAAEAAAHTEKQETDETHVITLDNGATVLTRKIGTQPLVNIEIVMRGGTREETREQAGISRMTAKMLMRGSAAYSREAIIEYFDSIGGDISASSGRNSCGIRAEVHKRDLAEALPMIADILINPQFPEDELAKERQLIQQALRSENDSWQGELSNRFRENFFQVHPYGNNPNGTQETLAAFSADDLAAFHKARTVGGNIIISVFGAVDRQTLAMVTKTFSAIPAGEYTVPEIPVEPQLQESRKVVIETKQQGIAGLYIGYPGVAYEDLEANAIIDVIDAMSSGVGYPGGWLHTKLRGAELVYVVHAFNVTGFDPGYFGVYAGCDPARLDQTIEIINEQIARLAAGAFSDAELRQAQELCILADQIEYQTPGQYAMRAALDTLYGLGHEFYKSYQDRINAVNREAIMTLADRLFQHQVMVLTVPKASE